MKKYPEYPYDPISDYRHSRNESDIDQNTPSQQQPPSSSSSRRRSSATPTLSSPSPAPFICSTPNYSNQYHPYAYNQPPQYQTSTPQLQSQFSHQPHHSDYLHFQQPQSIPYPTQQPFQSYYRPQSVPSRLPHPIPSPQPYTTPSPVYQPASSSSYTFRRHPATSISALLSSDPESPADNAKYHQNSRLSQPPRASAARPPILPETIRRYSASIDSHQPRINRKNVFLSLPDNVKFSIFNCLLEPYHPPQQQYYLDPGYCYQSDLIALSSTSKDLRNIICSHFWSIAIIYPVSLDFSFLEPPFNQFRLAQIKNLHGSKQRLVRSSQNQFCLLLSSTKSGKTGVPFPLSILQYTKYLSFTSETVLKYSDGYGSTEKSHIYKILNNPVLAGLSKVRIQISQAMQSSVIKYLDSYFSERQLSARSAQRLQFSLHLADSDPIRKISLAPLFAERIDCISLSGTKFHFDKASCNALESLRTIRLLHLPIDTKLSSNDRDQFNRKTRDLLINHFNKLSNLREIQIFSEDMSIPLNRQWIPPSVDTLTVNVLGFRKTPHVKEDLFDGVRNLTVICSPNRKPPIVPFPFRRLETLRIHRADGQTGSIKRCYEALQLLLHANPNIKQLFCKHIHPMDMSAIVAGGRNSMFQKQVKEIHLESHIRYRLSRLADVFYQPGSYNDDDEGVNSDDDDDAMNGILWFLNVDSLSGVLMELFSFSRLVHVSIPVLESTIKVDDIIKLAERNSSIKSLVLVYRTQKYINYISSRRPDLSYVNKFFYSRRVEGGGLSSIDSNASGGTNTVVTASPATPGPGDFFLPPLAIPATPKSGRGPRSGSDSVMLPPGSSGLSMLSGSSYDPYSSRSSSGNLSISHGDTPSGNSNAPGTSSSVDPRHNYARQGSHGNYYNNHNSSYSPTQHYYQQPSSARLPYPVATISASSPAPPMPSHGPSHVRSPVRGPVVSPGQNAGSSVKVRHIDPSKLFILLNPEEVTCSAETFRPVDHVAYYYTDLSLWKNLEA